MKILLLLLSLSGFIFSQEQCRSCPPGGDMGFCLTGWRFSGSTVDGEIDEICGPVIVTYTTYFCFDTDSSVVCKTAENADGGCQINYGCQ